MSTSGGPPGSSSSPDFRASVGTSSTAIDNNGPRQRPPRSLPPWIDSYETRYGSVKGEQLQSLQPPARSVLPQHNHAPAEPERRVSQDGYIDWTRDPLLDHAAPRSRLRLPDFIKHGRGAQHGRKWDHLRSAEPVIVAGYTPASKGPSTAWNEFVQSSIYGHMPGEESEIVDVEELDKLQPRFNLPVDAPLHPSDMRASRRRRTLALYKRVWNMILRHSLVPLAFRLTVMVTSILALAIAARIYEVENAEDRDSAERTQSIVAIAVDCVAVPYIGYMLWDEYTGKPLGLRPPVQKIALILLDLFFIIFKSASTALAFESLVYHNAEEATFRPYSKALASFMLVGLIAWTMTFMVNVFRTVERLGGGEDEGHM